MKVENIKNSEESFWKLSLPSEMAQLIVISLKLCLNFAFSQKSQWKMSFSAAIPFLSAEETEVTILHSTSLRTQPDCLLVSYSLTSKLFGTSGVSCIDALSLVLLDAMLWTQNFMMTQILAPQSWLWPMFVVFCVAPERSWMAISHLPRAFITFWLQCQFDSM